MRTGDSMVNVEVITPDTRCPQILPLPVRVLLPCRHPRIPDQLSHRNTSNRLATHFEYMNASVHLKCIVTRHSDPREHHKSEVSRRGVSQP